MAGNAYSGPMMAPRPREELIAACAVHGRSPFNDQTAKYHVSSDLEQQ